MSKLIDEIRVPTQKHGGNAYYSVCIREEEHNSVIEKVLKVIVYYDGKPNNRMTPSYPISSDDFERVTAAGIELLKRNNLK